MRRRRFPQPAAPVQIGPQRAAIYARVSTLSQKGRQDEDNKLSLEGQEVKCRLLCSERGYEVNEAYVVREVSSGANLFRPQLEEIYSAMKRGEINVLVMYNVSRFARDDDNATYQYIRATKELHITIVFVDAPSEERLQKFHRKFQGMFSEEFRAFVMKETHEKRRERVTRRGLLLPGAWPLYGYVYDDPVKKRRYLIDEEAAAVVRHMFALAARGYSLGHIAQTFNAEGILTPTAYQRSKGRLPESRKPAKEWQAANITRMLHTPAYWGEHLAFRQEHKRVVEQDQSTGRYEEFHVIRYRTPEESEAVLLPPEICPPLVEKWQAEMALQRLAANKREAGKQGRSTREAMLRGGYILCGYCNRPMYCISHNVGHPQYRCASMHERRDGRALVCTSNLTVSHHIIDALVWHDLMSFFDNPNWLHDAYERARARDTKTSEQRKERLADITKQLAAKEASANELFAMTTQITSAAMRERLTKQLNELGAQIELLQTEQAELEAPAATEETLRAQQAAAKRWSEQVMAGSEHASLDDKRAVLYWLGAQVRLWREQGKIDYEFVLTWRGLNAGRPLVLHERESYVFADR